MKKLFLLVSLFFLMGSALSGVGNPPRPSTADEM